MRVISRSSYVLVAGISLCVACGCRQAPAVEVKVAPPAKLENGWTNYESAADGFSIGIPSGWKVSAMGSMMPSGVMTDFLQNGGASPDQPTFDPSKLPQPGDLASASAELEKMEAEAERRATEALRKKGVLIQIVDGSRPTPGEERTRFYVRANDHGGNLNLESAIAEEKEHLRMYLPTMSKVNLPIGPAARFESEHETRGGDKVHQVSFVTVDHHKAWILRFISTNNPTAVTSVADAVAQTWRIRPSKGS